MTTHATTALLLALSALLLARPADLPAAEEDVRAGRFALPQAKARILVNNAHASHLPRSIVPDPQWTEQAAQDAKGDFRSIPYDGVKPNSMVCDTTLRALPDGSWALFLLAGGDFEPSPDN